MLTGNNYYWEHKIVYILFFKFHKYTDRIKVSADSNTNFFMLSSVYRIFTKLYDRVPENFETFIGMSEVGPKTIRALSLISELSMGRSPVLKTLHGTALLMAGRMAIHIR